MTTAFLWYVATVGTLILMFVLISLLPEQPPTMRCPHCKTEDNDWRYGKVEGTDMWIHRPCEEERM